MRVQTDFEVKHFVKYVNNNKIDTTMDIIEYVDKHYITTVNGTAFEIFEDILPYIQTTCQDMVINFKLIH